MDDGDYGGALSAFEEAVDLRPALASAWFNMALVHKMQRNWHAAVSCGERAAAAQPDDYPTWWNLGIAATATSKWALAREAWRRCGIEVPDGTGAIEPLALGPVPIRINPQGRAEVVWAERLDPARARIENIPLPGSGHRWNDIVLHDGVPVGERTLGGRAVPVFDELVRLVPSDTPTLQAHVSCAGEAASTSLVELFGQHGLAAEDWTASVRHLCESCSGGSVSATSRDTGASVPRRHFGLAADQDDALSLLTRWQAEGTGRTFESVEDAT